MTRARIRWMAKLFASSAFGVEWKWELCWQATFLLTLRKFHAEDGYCEPFIEWDRTGRGPRQIQNLVFNLISSSILLSSWKSYAASIRGEQIFYCFCSVRNTVCLEYVMCEKVLLIECGNRFEAKLYTESASQEFIHIWWRISDIFFRSAIQFVSKHRVPRLQRAHTFARSAVYKPEKQQMRQTDRRCTTCTIPMMNGKIK